MEFERESGGRYWRIKPKGNGTPDNRRFLKPSLIDTESCTHTLGLPGCRCPFCGGTVPADG